MSDVSMLFGTEELLARPLGLSRKGSLNFVVGVNGSGKSSLLRALFQVFRSLHQREMPAFPVTVVWDRLLGGVTQTIVFHFAANSHETSFFATLQHVSVSRTRLEWEQIIADLKESKVSPAFFIHERVTGPDIVSHALLLACLPKRVVAYTSGTEEQWLKLEQPSFHPKDEGAGEYEIESERPHGWRLEYELKEQFKQISEALNATESLNVGSNGLRVGTGRIGEPPDANIEQWLQMSKSLEAIRKKITLNTESRQERPNDACIRVFPKHFLFAGIVTALWNTAKELCDRTSEAQRTALRQLFLQPMKSGENITYIRRFLNHIDWFWPTHLSFTYHAEDKQLTSKQQVELYCLLALAEEVIAQPQGRYQVVISLAPSDRVSISEAIKVTFPMSNPSASIEAIAKRVDNCKTKAEAFLRVFSDDTELDSTPMAVFARLRDWEGAGLLESITMIVKRLHQTDADEGPQEDVIVTYDQLSDGEQMLLGRLGLLLLLRGQDGSLLLLDEPETHFNDAWKREIVDMIDTTILDSTNANVILSTHTSIVLTDAFAAEVTVLDKNAGKTCARSVTGGLFGTDPGEVAMNLFRTENSIGRRATECLEKLLKTDWHGQEEQLEGILKILGSSFHRAELRAILNQLKKNTDGVTSS